ncbi:hypothetical protein ADMFC3_02770 [Geovibrio sp. ADMFC3]|jgi:hypothetical protein|nr:hypothetical protein [Spirochaetia bacterium]
MSSAKFIEKTENLFEISEDEIFCAVEGHIGFDTVKAAQEKKDAIEEKMLTISVR